MSLNFITDIICLGKRRRLEADRERLYLQRNNTVSRSLFIYFFVVVHSLWIFRIYQWDLFLRPSTRMQTAALWHCIQNNQEIPWIGLFDLDEFAFPVRKTQDKNLVNILKEFDDTDIGVISSFLICSY